MHIPIQRPFEYQSSLDFEWLVLAGTGILIPDHSKKPGHIYPVFEQSISLDRFIHKKL
jgi:hypothetical protein